MEFLEKLDDFGNLLNGWRASVCFLHEEVAKTFTPIPLHGLR